MLGLRSAPPAHTPASGSQIWLTALCLVLVFTVTLSVFPAITAMVTSSTSPGKWSECWEAERAGQGSEGERRKTRVGTKMSPFSPPGQFFNPICCFLLFNVMDWLGRSLTSYFLWVGTPGRGSDGFRKQLGIRGCEGAQKGDVPIVQLVWAWERDSPPAGSEHPAPRGIRARGWPMSSLKAEPMSS